MMEGLKKRTRKAFGIRKKEKDSDSTGSPDAEGGQRKTNGAPNGFYGEIDWERYNSPEVDDEGYSIRPEDEVEGGDGPKTHFFSSDESEGEEDHKKKFKIKIKPLPADCVVAAPSFEELKASIGNIALSPSPMRRSPGLKRNTSSEEIARPRRVVLSVAPPPVAAPQPPCQHAAFAEDSTALFGPPLETAFEAEKTEAPPPLPPKNVQTPPPTTNPQNAEDTEVAEDDISIRKPSIADVDNFFGPEQDGTAEPDTGDSWVCFSDKSPEQPSPLKHPAPPLPSSTPPPQQPPPSLPLSMPSLESWAPPLPTSPSPFEDQATYGLTSPPKETSALPTSSPPSEPPAAHSNSLGPSTPDDRPLPTSPTPVSSPSSSLPPLESPAISSPSPKPFTPPLVSPPPEQQSHAVPPPLVLSEDNTTRDSEVTPSKEDQAGTFTSTKDSSQESRSTPPPPPPPTYRAVVSSPGPTSTTGGATSESLSPVRPATPSFVNPPPPPPPPRPPSRPKLPPGKPTMGDTNRPFSPPVHTASPPPVAPLARAESTSSISSTNSLSAATTPTVGKELSVSVSGCSRGPSPLTMGAQDTLPVAAAFTETVNAVFKGADPNKCVVKIIGEMVLSFPAGITRHFANNPSPAVLTFSITNYSRLEHVLPNPQLLCCDTTTQAKANAKDFWVKMPNLITHLKKVAEQKPQATYYNVDMLKYQVSVQGLQSTPLNLAVSWRCEPNCTDLRIDYKYNGDAMSTPMALNNVQFLVPVDGGVSKLQAVLPPAVWNAEQQRILWKIPDISHKSENGGVGSLLARFQLNNGPSKPAPLALQFTSEGSNLSGCDIELAGPGYRFSLIKKRFAAGKYLADN